MKEVAGGEKRNVEAIKEKITDGTREWNLDGMISFIFIWETSPFFFLRKEDMKRIDVDIYRDTYIFEEGIGDSSSLHLCQVGSRSLANWGVTTVTAREVVSLREPALN